MSVLYWKLPETASFGYRWRSCTRSCFKCFWNVEVKVSHQIATLGKTRLNARGDPWMLLPPWPRANAEEIDSSSGLLPPVFPSPAGFLGALRVGGWIFNYAVLGIPAYSTGISIPLSPKLCLFCSAHSESSLWTGKYKHNLGDNGMDTPVMLLEGCKINYTYNCLKQSYALPPLLTLFPSFLPPTFPFPRASTFCLLRQLQG